MGKMEEWREANVTVWLEEQKSSVFTFQLAAKSAATSETNQQGKINTE